MTFVRWSAMLPEAGANDSMSRLTTHLAKAMWNSLLMYKLCCTLLAWILLKCTDKLINFDTCWCHLFRCSITLPLSWAKLINCCFDIDNNRKLGLVPIILFSVPEDKPKKVTKFRIFSCVFSEGPVTYDAINICRTLWYNLDAILKNVRL